MMIKQCKGKSLDKVAKSKLPNPDDLMIVSTKYDGNYVQIHTLPDRVEFFTRMIKQCKGKALEKVPKSKLPNPDDLMIVSTKYDGNYVQIHILPDRVEFFTSGGKQFHFKDLEEELLEISDGYTYILEGEYIGTTEGKLGDRVHCSTGHYRSQFSKGITTNINDGKIMVFDALHLGTTKPDIKLNILQVEIFNHLDADSSLQLVETDTIPFYEVEAFTRNLVQQGYEGTMVKTFDYVPLAGKRVNNSIKVKYRKTADLLCIDMKEGTGKYEGMIGSLLLRDSNGITVDVGSGLSDDERLKDYSYFVGKVVEIEYEQLLDTYIQPVFKCIRDKEDID